VGARGQRGDRAGAARAGGRALLESGQQPRKPDEFADLVRALGYMVEPGPEASSPDAPTALDIVVREF